MADYIKADELKITCNIPVNQILSLSIREDMGSHSMAEIKAVTQAGGLELSGTELNSQPVIIDAVRNGETRQLFSGVIRRLSMEKAALYDTISISAYSLSWFMDLEKKNRSFQDGGQTVLKLMEKAAKAHAFGLIGSVGDQAVTEPFIQYRETDWEFLLRLSTHLKAPVFVANEYEGRGIYIGLRERADPVEIHAIRQVWGMDAGRAQFPGREKWDDTYYEIWTDRLLHVGQGVICRNEALWAYKARLTLERGVLQCVYRVAGKNYSDIRPAFNPHIRGVSLTGTVLARQGESIKIHLDIDEKQDAGHAHPYPWLPEHGNMFFCMPKEGERVRLLVPDGDERHAFGINCVRQNGRTCEETQNTAERRFTTESGKTLALLPSSFELSSDRQETGVAIRDGVGDIISSGAQVTIRAKGRLRIKGARVELKAPAEITAVKRRLGSPAVLNICRNLDSMGESTTFKNTVQAGADTALNKTSVNHGGKGKADGADTKDAKQYEPLKFRLKEVMEKESRENTYDFGPSIVNILSAIPQEPETDKLARIAMGFCPIAGNMKGD